MRRTVFVLALLAAAPGSAAAGVRWGAEAGAQWGRLVEGSDLGAHREWSPGPALGMRTEARLGRLVLLCGLRLVDQREQRRTEVAVDPGTGPITYSFVSREHLLALAVPMELAWRFPHGVTVEAGPEVRWLARATLQMDAFASPALTAAREPAARIFETFGDTPDVTPHFERWSLGLRAGVGVRWPLDSHEAHAMLRYARGVTRLSREIHEGARAEGLEFALGLAW